MICHLWWLLLLAVVIDGIGVRVDLFFCGILLLVFETLVGLKEAKYIWRFAMLVIEESNAEFFSFNFLVRLEG